MSFPRDSFTYCSELLLLPRFAVAFIKRCLQYHSPFIIATGLIETICPSFLPISCYSGVQCTDVLSEANREFWNETHTFHLTAWVAIKLIFSKGCTVLSTNLFFVRED